jgi:hypothetical protein
MASSIPTRMRSDLLKRAFLSGFANHSCRSRIDHIARFAIHVSRQQHA